jgi:site-specific DNA recombinase
MGSALTARTMRVALYGRTSDDRSEGKSVDDQLAALDEWATEEGHDVVARFRDDGISASAFAMGKVRPEWQRLTELIRARAVDMIGVWEQSRLTRDRMTWAQLIGMCIAAGVLIAVDGTVYDPRDPDQAHALDQMAASSTQESGKISKRVKRAARGRAARGAPHGSLHYGYRNERDPVSGKTVRRVIDPDQADVVREIVRRALAGESLAGIARSLTARGIGGPRGGVWHGQNVGRLVMSPTIAGLRQHQGEVLEGVTAAWEPIITVEEHRQVTAMLTDPTRRSTRTGAHVRHLLPGVARCGVCGGPIRALTRKLLSGRGTRIIYNCRTSFCVGRMAEDVDRLVELVMVGLLERPELTERLAADDPEAMRAGETVARLRAKLEEARRLVADDRLSLASLVDLEARTLPKLEAAERAARPKHVPTVVLDAIGPDAAERWAALSMAQRREVVRALADVRIMPAGRRDGSVPFDPECVSITPRV